MAHDIGSVLLRCLFVLLKPSRACALLIVYCVLLIVNNTVVMSLHCGMADQLRPNVSIEGDVTQSLTTLPYCCVCC